MTRNWLVILFWIATVAGCIVSELNLPSFDFFIKPLLMPLLMWWMIIDIGPTQRPVLIMAGLFFSWMGDVFLMFEKDYPVCFILGLASFLITHILYTTWFISERRKNAIHSGNWKYGILVFGYAIMLVIFLYPHLGNLKIPVLIYAVVISAMMFAAIRFPNIPVVRQILISGAIWFVFSDSLLAINKFWEPLPFAATMIRFSYSLAQFLIVAAIIRYRNNTTVVNLGT